MLQPPSGNRFPGIPYFYADLLDLVGIIVYGENKKVGKALDGLKFHD
ncbi:hypothetical protein [Chryseobacterium sp. WLY505]|nr:hypothetical protein [Chryseobacterium sp. WLY505]MDQ1857004.1 hypothetical protein [Chryseobacterium sp. WLY505]